MRKKCHSLLKKIKYSFSEPSFDNHPNQLFPTNRGYQQRSFYGGRNRPFNKYNQRGNNTYQQQYRPQNK